MDGDRRSDPRVHDELTFHRDRLIEDYIAAGMSRAEKYQTLRSPLMNTMYTTWLQRQGDQPTRYSYLARVGTSDPMRFTPALDRLVRDVDRSLRVRSLLPYATLIDRSIGTERTMASLATFFGGLSLLVAAIGLFGLLAFQVSRRTNELGIRIAIGATRSRIVVLVLRDVALMIAAGVLVGTAVALTLTGLARSLLFGLTPTDPVAFTIATVVLALTAFAAAWLPARRASRVDPLVALRHE